jgi:transcriptional regulator with XRE-family HTH domain
MNDIQRTRAEHVQALMNRAPMPRNQVAAISGLSNAYILKLEQGGIASVRREKLIALAVSLQLSLWEIDNLLALFDRTPLSDNDLTFILDLSARIRISGALYPVNNTAYMLLMFLAVERQPGRLTILTDNPTGILRPEKYRSYIDRHLIAKSALHAKLVEEITRRRRLNLKTLLREHPVENIITLEALKRYMAQQVNPKERTWRTEHLNNLINCLEEFPKFSVRLTNVYPNFLFSLKESTDEDHTTDKLLFCGKPDPLLTEAQPGKLLGFVTDNPLVIGNFKEEINYVRAATCHEYEDRCRLINFLKSLEP